MAENTENQGETGKKPEGAPPAGTDKATQLELELAETRKQHEALKKQSAAREKKDRDAEDAKRLADEGAQKLLTERTKELDSMKAEIEALRAAEAARADRLFAALPEASRKKLEGFKEAMSPDKWTALLEAEGATAGGTGKDPLPPPTGSLMPAHRKGLKEGETYQPTDGARKMLDEFNVSEQHLRHVDVVVEQGDKDDPASAMVRKFTMPVKRMYERMNKVQGHPFVFKTENK